MDFTVASDAVGQRLDKWLHLQLPGRSRTSIQRLIENERVTVDEHARPSSFPLRGGERIAVELESDADCGLRPVAMELVVVYEDEHLLALDKPQGLTVHTSTRPGEVTVVNGLLARGCPLSSLGDPDRPGIVHRLDKHTSGLLLVAKTNEAHAALGEAFRLRKIEKRYTALVVGNVAADEYVVDAPIGRDPRWRQRMAVVVGGERHALTTVRVVERLGDFTLVHAHPRTGRTHQIRVHLAHLSHPIAGDVEYGGRKRARAMAERRRDTELVALLAGLPGQLLHANELRFAHPVTGAPITLQAELPPTFQAVLDRLKLPCR